MEIRIVEKHERDLANYLGSMAFVHGRRRAPWTEDPNEPEHVIYGLWDERGYQAQVVILSFASIMGPSVVLPMGGIAGVACMPAARGRGYVRMLMIRALEHMKEAGQCISTLFPFSYEFYRQLGWEWIGIERRYGVASQALKRSEHTDRCRHADESDRAGMIEAYTNYSRRYRGMLDRDARLWAKLLDGSAERHAYTFVYDGESGIEGYVTFVGGSDECIDIDEFIALHPSARQGLLGLLRRMNMQTRRFAWSGPEDDGLWMDLCHHALETKIAPVTQGRVVDIGAALGQWTPAAGAEGSFSLRIRDAIAPWNEAPLRVEFGAGSAAVRAWGEEPDLEMDIQTFSQAYFGSPSIDLLAANDRLTVRRPEALHAFREFLSGPLMWMNDHF